MTETVQAIEVSCFDEAVEILDKRRSGKLTDPIRVVFKFCVKHLPRSVIDEYRSEAESLGLIVLVA